MRDSPSDRVFEHDNRFHITIAEATGNPIFIKVVETSANQTVRLWFSGSPLPDGNGRRQLAEAPRHRDAIVARARRTPARRCAIT